jgi:hypothetical protein
MERLMVGRTSLALSLACCLALTAAEARALALGELVLHSRLGQPLRAQLALTTGPGEAVDESCIALAKAAGASGDQIPSLTRARFSVEASGAGQLIRISTLHAISEPAVRLVLQLNCDGQANMSREFTLLLDPPDYVTTIEGTPAVAERNPQALAETANDALPLHAATRPQGMPSPAPARVKARTKTVDTAPRKQSRKETGRPEGFRLRLSTGAIDLTASSRMTEAERLQLREKQLLLEADDQVATILALKDRIKQLETQLAEIKLKVSTSVAQLPPVLAQPAIAKPAGTVAQPPAQRPGRYFFWLGLAILFPLLVVFIVVRNRRRRESQLQWEMEREYVLEAATEQPPPAVEKPEGVAAARPMLTAMEARQKPAAEEVYYDPTSIFNPPDEKITLTEVDSVVEEADLYMIYGWTQKAIELLLQHVEKNPAEAQPWMMLFDIYHSQGLEDAFEKLAKRFHSAVESAELWQKVQGLGRDLDPQNSLYVSASGDAAVGRQGASGEAHWMDGPLSVFKSEAGDGTADAPAQQEPASNSLKEKRKN